MHYQKNLLQPIVVFNYEYLSLSGIDLKTFRTQAKKKKKHTHTNKTKHHT